MTLTADHASASAYVCNACSHQWCSPEWPDRCENCGESSDALMQFTDPDAADEYSGYVWDWLVASRGPTR